jgi:hypothetical protein
MLECRVQRYNGTKTNLFVEKTSYYCAYAKLGGLLPDLNIQMMQE